MKVKSKMLIWLVFLGFFSSKISLASKSGIPQTITSNNSSDQRIVGGIAATAGEFPYQGLLLSSNGLCGCALIQTTWALTAAHCTNGLQAADLQVTFGLTDRSNPSVFFTQTRTVQNLYQYPFYTSSSNLYDISLMQFSAVTTSTYVMPIQLPTITYQFLGVNENACDITGWGATTEGASGTPATLMKATVPLVSTTQCSTWYSSQNIDIDASTMICAGLENGGTDTCQGDSGGPLACRVTSTGESVLIGITSFGVGCARAQLPGVYTRVFSYSSWISTTMATASLAPVSGSTGLYHSSHVVFFLLLLLKLWFY